MTRRFIFYYYRQPIRGVAMTESSDDSSHTANYALRLGGRANAEVLEWRRTAGLLLVGYSGSMVRERVSE